MLLILEDSRGYYFAHASRKGGRAILDNGRDVTESSVIGATQANIEAILDYRDPVYWMEVPPEYEKLRTVLEGEDVLSMLRMRGFSVNHDLHIFKRMSGLFLELNANHAKPIIEAHREACGNQDPANIPVLLLESPCEGVNIGMDVQGKIRRIGEEAGGEIVLGAEARTAFHYKDWCVMPAGPREGIFRPSSSDRPLPQMHEFREALKASEVLLTEEGYLLRSGEAKLGALTLSAADF